MEIDEHTSGAPGTLNTSGMADKLKPSATFESDFNVEFLRIYYDKVFPYELMYKWLSYFKTTDADTTQ